MKTEISRDSHKPGKRYSGVYQQQGRMLTDADWNELVEILKSQLNESLKDVVGYKEGSVGGTPRHRALRIIKDGVIKIKPGNIYIDGMAASLPDKAPYIFTEQPDFPSAEAPTGDYILYADVWERTVTYLHDPAIRDAGLHGADTCSRKEKLAQVKWCRGINPEDDSTNPAKGTAPLSLTLRNKITEADDCDPCAAELDIDSRVGNYLFRVEVHDVQGDADKPDSITLKWSSENGAEQFQALSNSNDMPAEFIGNKWVYEFFDATSERHLGVHLNDSGTWDPARSDLHQFNETNVYSIEKPDNAETDTYIRRWDGYCTLDFSGDMKICIDQGSVVDPGDYSLDSTKLEIALASINLELDLASKSFVAGDFWLAEVREAEHSEGSKLLELQPPQGIEHYYLKLGTVTGDTTLEDNEEIDRKYAFPSLTEMTRLFHGGGDGQEAMPNHFVPLPIEAIVTNGEWPVSGVKIEFVVTDGGGKLESHPDFTLENFNPAISDKGIATTGEGERNGMVQCLWKLGDSDRKQRITARLVDPDSKPGDTGYPKYLAHPPIHFYANLSTADQVAYDNPNCSHEPSVNTLLQNDSNIAWPDYDGDGDVTVKDVLDALLCELKSSHIPYDDPACTGNTVRHLLGNLNFDGDAEGILTVKDILDTLLCKLKAEHIPYNPDLTPGVNDRWGDINDPVPTRPTNVQKALDDLVKYLESTDIRYEVKNCGTTAAPTVRSKLEIPTGTTKIDSVLDKLLCDFKADDLPINKSSALCNYLKDDSSVKTVQDAINALCDKGQSSCVVTVGKDGDYQTIDEAILKPKYKDTLNICLLPGEHVLGEKIEESIISIAKKNVSIVGFGASILLRKPLSISVNGGLNFKGVTFQLEGGNKKTSGDVSVLITCNQKAKVTIDGCSFNRIYVGSNKKWSPALKLVGSGELKWSNSDMTCKRRFIENTKFLPDDVALSANGKNAYLSLIEIMASSEIVDDKKLDSKIELIAKKISKLSNKDRLELYKKRPKKYINKLPDKKKPIFPSRRRRVTGDPLITDRLLENVFVEDVDSASIKKMTSYKSSVESFYNMLNSDKPIKATTAKEMIKDFVLKSIEFDYGLALESNKIDGVVEKSDFDCYLGLNYRSDDMVPLDIIDGEADLSGKNNLKKYLTPLLKNISGSLYIKDNHIYAIHSMVSSKELSEINKIVKSGSSENIPNLGGYLTFTFTGNLFNHDWVSGPNSFVGFRMTINDNFLPFVQADFLHVIGRDGFIMGNSGSNFAKLVEVFKSYLPAGNGFNYIDIV